MSIVTANEVLKQIFAEHYKIDEQDNVIFGEGVIDKQQFHLLGVKESTDFGVTQALLMAEKVLALLESKSHEPV